MELNSNFYTKKYFLTATSILLLLLICLAYSNHFNNGFEFDDSHSIVQNEYIRDIKNIPFFFTDIKYYGTNPGNQGYNPVLVTLNAIDYWMGGGLKPVYFHASIFASYILLLLLLFFFFRTVFNVSSGNKDNNIAALLLIAFYGIHTANAETINYIIMRSDSFSTLCIVASLLLYIHTIGRKYYLYLVTLALAMGTKETGSMFGPILFFYILFFEENISLTELVTFKKINCVIISLKKSFPTLLFSFGVFYLIGKIFFATDGATAISSPQPETWKYFYTQWVIISHYIGNFILPLDLSADPDFVLIDSVINRKVLLGLALILTMVTIAFVTSNKKETRPIAFGIMWFFIALAPTSTIFALTQTSNDHRTFFPFIGLVLSLGWWLYLLVKKNASFILSSSILKYGLITVYFIIIVLHAYGTYQRNIIWGSSATLWHDASIKSPNNGRAQMNYGLTLMAEGKYEEALTYFKRTLDLMPYWAYIHINMGILREAMGFSKEAEEYYLNAIRYQPYVPDGYYHYAQWLSKKGRIDEAISQLEKGKEISPGHTGINEYLNSLLAQKGETKEDKIKKLEEYALGNPSVNNYIELSLVYYRNGMYKECVSASEKVLELDTKSAIAYNNMCSAYNAMGQWKKAVEACEKALQIEPSFERAKNNLNWALKNTVGSQK